MLHTRPSATVDRVLVCDRVTARAGCKLRQWFVDAHDPGAGPPGSRHPGLALVLGAAGVHAQFVPEAVAPLSFGGDGAARAQVVVPGTRLGGAAAGDGGDLQRYAHPVEHLELPAVLVEPRERALAGERGDIEEQEAVIGEQFPSAPGEPGEKSQAFVCVVETPASVSEAQRIAAGLMSETNARSMSGACINACLVRNPEPQPTSAKLRTPSRCRRSGPGEEQRVDVRTPDLRALDLGTSRRTCRRR